MSALLGNVEVVLGVRFKPSTPDSMIEHLAWATHRKLYFDNKNDFHKHPFAWIFHSRVGKFAGFHASRIWHTPKTGFWHLSTHFSCNNFTRAVQALLDYIKPIVMPEGFAGYIIGENESCPVLIYFLANTGMILQSISAEDGVEIDSQTLAATQE